MDTDTDIDSAVAIWTPSSLLLALGPLTAVVTVPVLLRLSPSESTRVVGSSGGLRGRPASSSLSSLTRGWVLGWTVRSTPGGLDFFSALTVSGAKWVSVVHSRRGTPRLRVQLPGRAVLATSPHGVVRGTLLCCCCDRVPRWRRGPQEMR